MRNMADALEELDKAKGYLVDMSCMESEPQPFASYALASIAHSLVAIGEILAKEATPRGKH